MKKFERITLRSENFADWYTNIIDNAKLIKYGSIKGTMVFQPNGWAIWESIKVILDKEFAKIGIQNVSLPLLIPYEEFAKEKEHIEGFAPELYMVTKIGDKVLDKPYVIRPTSEISFCNYFSAITNSHKDLPLKFNQWCNVMRAEKTTRPFLRNSEFHWQEMHSIHSSETEAYEFSKTLINLYNDFVNQYLCIPTIIGEKTAGERFAGASNTFTIEALMQDGQALQCGTSHYLAQSFAKPYNIKFQNKDNKFSYAFQTSAGVSTRLIGALIMVHADDKGLVLPPLMAPTQVVIIPVFPEKNIKVKQITSQVAKSLEDLRIKIDDSDKGLGFKAANHEIAGTPIQIHIGPRDLEQGKVVISRRDTGEKQFVALDEIKNTVAQLLVDIKDNIYKRAKLQLDNSIVSIDTIEGLKAAIKDKKLASAYWAGTIEDETKLKQLTGITPRCIIKDNVKGKCFFTNQKATKLVIFGRAY